MQGSASGDHAGAETGHIGLVVVHGVGMTESGYALNTLVETLARSEPGYTFNRTTALDWGEDARSQSGEAKFPIAVRSGDYKQDIAICATELHWADLTNLQPGRINATLGSFRVIFESHHFVDAMLRRGKDMLAKFLRLILWIAGWMMRGPIAALTIAVSAYTMFLLFGPVIPLEGVQGSFVDRLLGDVHRRFLIVETGVVVAGVWALRWLVRNRDITWYDTAFWTVALTTLLLILDVSGYLASILAGVPSIDGKPVNTAACETSSGAAICYIEGLYRLIILGWRAFGGILLVALAALVWRTMTAQSEPRRASVAPIASSIATVILQFMLWTVIVVTLLYSMLNRAEISRDLRDHRGEIVKFLTKENMNPDSAAFKFFQFPDVDFGWLERFKFVYAMTALTIVMSIAVGALLVWRRRHLAETAGPDRSEQAARMPRVLFSPYLVGTLIAQFLLLIGIVYFQWRAEQDFAAFKELRKWFLPVAALVSITAPLALGHRAANFVHIARDVIDHQFNLRIESMTYFFPSLFKGAPIHPRREQIQARLTQALDGLCHARKLDGLVFVAHSQGSVVAFDYIRQHLDKHPVAGGVKVQFLSFGSPLGHVYQKYFHEYDSDGAHWLAVCERVDRWINLYRIDDPIGDAIKVPEGADIDNVAMAGLGGHMNYWNDKELAAALHKLIQHAASSREGYVPAPDPPREMPQLWIAPLQGKGVRAMVGA